VPGQEGVQTTSPYLIIEPGKQRPNHGSFSATVIDQRKAIDAQVFCKPIECMLDGQQYCEVQEACRDLAQIHSADDLGPHLCENTLSNPRKSHAFQKAVEFSAQNSAARVCIADKGFVSDAG